MHEVTCQLLHFCMRPRVSCCTCARGHVSSDALVHEATCQLLYLCTRPRVCCCTCWCPLSLTLGNGHAYRILSLSMRIGYHCQPIVFPHVFPTLFVQMRTGWLSMVMAVGQRDHRLVPTIGSVMKLMCVCVCEYTKLGLVYSVIHACSLLATE